MPKKISPWDRRRHGLPSFHSEYKLDPNDNVVYGEKVGIKLTEKQPALWLKREGHQKK